MVSLLKKSEFRDAVKLGFDWEVPNNTPSPCACFEVDFFSRNRLLFLSHFLKAEPLFFPFHIMPFITKDQYSFRITLRNFFLIFYLFGNSSMICKKKKNIITSIISFEK